MVTIDYGSASANMYNICLWVVILGGHNVLLAAALWRRLSGMPRGRGLWAVLSALLLVASFSASIGVGYAYGAYAFHDTYWVLAMILSMATVLPLEVWAMSARTEATWTELISLLTADGTSVAAFVFFFLAAAPGGALANLLPASLCFALPLVLLVITVATILEDVQDISASYSKLSEEENPKM